MKVAVISDSHDHIWNLQKVLDEIKNNVDEVVHCGDIVAPFSIKLLSTAKLSTHLFFGNNDGDISGLIEKAAKNIKWVPIRKEFGEIIFNNRKIAFCHYKKMADFLAKSSKYDAVFYGHTHVPDNKKANSTLLLNPGAVCGIQNGKPAKATYAIYDTETNSAEIIEIK
jgi:putative phosphoesterase